MPSTLQFTDLYGLFETLALNESVSPNSTELVFGVITT
jgi:hypothetical protein